MILGRIISSILFRNAAFRYTFDLTSAVSIRNGATGTRTEHIRRGCTDSTTFSPPFVTSKLQPSKPICLCEECTSLLVVKKVSEFNVAAGRTILEELENNVAKSTWFEDVDDKFSTCSSIQASSRSGSISEPTCTSRNVTLCRDSGNTLRILDSCTFVLHLRCGARVVKRTTSFDSCVAI